MAQAKTKTKITRSKRKAKWTEEHFAIRKLLEEELHGLLTYIRSIHNIAILLVMTSIVTLLYALNCLFQADHKAVIAYLIIILTSLCVVTTATWVLRPWIVPRFLLPMDMNNLNLAELKQLFKDPDEYLMLLKTHTQILTDQFLLPKLSRLRNAIAVFVFGVSIAILLSIALP
jgi:hypothetical protein